MNKVFSDYFFENLIPTCFLAAIYLSFRSPQEQLVLIRGTSLQTDVCLKPGSFSQFCLLNSVFSQLGRNFSPKQTFSFHLLLRSGPRPTERQRGGRESAPADHPVGDVWVRCDAMPQLQSDGVSGSSILVFPPISTLAPTPPPPGSVER